MELLRKKKKQSSNEYHGLPYRERRKKILQIYKALGTTDVSKTDLAKRFGVGRKAIWEDHKHLKDAIAKIPRDEIMIEYGIATNWIRNQCSDLLKSDNESVRLGALKLILHSMEKDIDNRQKLGFIDMPIQKVEMLGQMSYDEFRKYKDKVKGKSPAKKSGTKSD